MKRAYSLNPFLATPPCPQTGGGVHTWLLSVANIGRIRGASESETMDYLRDHSRQCGRSVNEKEIGDAVRKAYQSNWTPPANRASYHPTVKPTFKPDVLARLAAKLPAVDESWLAIRSPRTVHNRNPANFFHQLYKPGERVVIFNVFESQGCTVWTQTEPPHDTRQLAWLEQGQPQGVWFLPQPVTGEYHPNPREGGKLSRRSQEAVTAFRYAVLESDQADPLQWLAALVQLPAPIAAIYTSGGKSIHALLQVNATTKEHWDAIIKPMQPALTILGADPAALSAVRLSRLPSCERVEKQQMQRLLYLNPNPTTQPIADNPLSPYFLCQN